MKKPIILLTALCGLNAAAYAQTSFNAIEYADINNIKAGHLVHGDMWSNPATGTPACEFPKGSGKHVAGLGSLWFCGYDASGNLAVTAQTYRQTGNDYYPGPVDTGIHDSTQASQYAAKWARIWKVNRTTIDSFKALTTHTVSNTPAVILEWPARGNTRAKGAQQSALTISKDMAPFVDVNQDGAYNALEGDYPLIKGDQMLWSVFNDVLSPKMVTRSATMGLEIRRAAYAYSRNSGLDNIMFYEYNISNAGTNRFSAFRMGLNADPDLGYAFDDFIGFDSSHRMGYVYNQHNPDGAGGAGSYGTDIPVAGFSILELPGDHYPALVPAGNFVPYINGSAGGSGSPRTALEFAHLLYGENRNGDPLHNDMANGASSTAFGSGPAARYAFDGDPGNSAEWSQCQNRVGGGDQRFLIATDTFAFSAGDTRKLGFALLVSPHAGSCGTLDLTGLKQLADSALITYYNPPAAPLGLHNTATTAKSLKVYPNPSRDLLHIRLPDDGAATISLYDANGRLLSIVYTEHQKEAIVETARLAAGMYLVVYHSGQTVANNTFIKE